MQTPTYFLTAEGPNADVAARVHDAICVESATREQLASIVQHAAHVLVGPRLPRALLDGLEDAVWGLLSTDPKADAQIFGRTKVLPIYRPLDHPYDRFNGLADAWPRICVDIAGAAPSALPRLIATVGARRLEYPATWVHLRGPRPSEHVSAYLIDSVDSADWSDGARWMAVNETVAGVAYSRAERVADPADPTSALVHCAHAAHALQATWRSLVHAWR